MATVWRRATPLALTLSLLLAVAVVGARDAGRAAPGVPPGEILVRWQGGTAPPDADLPRGLTPAGGLAGIGVERYQVAPGSGAAQLAALRADPRVEFAEPNGRYHLTSTPNDPQFPRQWNMRQIHAPEAWDVGTGAADVIVAVLDSGIDGSHVELAGRVLPGRNVRERNSSTQDEIGHGTHVAGVVGATGNDGIGVAGLSWGVRLMPIKITDRFGDASIAAAADGIRWAIENNARVINLSFGGLDDSQTVRLAVQDARSRGVLLVAAAGNCGEVASYRDEGCEAINQPIYPAALSGVIAVGALGANDEIASYSNAGDYVRLAAPGGVGGSNRGNPLDYVFSTAPPNLPSPIGMPGYSLEVGTSMAAPHVSGTAALIWSTNPNLSRDQVENILFETADDLGPTGRDDRYGFGRVNTARALQRAASLPGNRAANIQLNLESPTPDAVVAGTLVVNGWAVDDLSDGGTGIDLVEAYLDGPPGQGQSLGQVSYGVARPDVARLLDRGGFANAGFGLSTDVRNGTHTLWVRAHSSLSGAWNTRQIRFTVTGGAPGVSIPNPGGPAR